MHKNRFCLKPVLIILLITLFTTGCAESGGGSGGGTETDPPDNLIGTFALNNGKPAVMNIQIASNANLNIAAGQPARSPGNTVRVTGNVRYDKDDYIVSGLYNNGTGKLDLFAENSGGWRFIFSGYYTAAAGFSGTVTLYDSDESEITTGTVSAAAAADSETVSVRIFTGSFGGTGAYGTWNGTLKDNRFYGTWAFACYAVGESHGTVNFSVSGTSMTLIHNPASLPDGGEGRISGSSVSGHWFNYGGGGGSWAGIEVDGNYDSHTPGSDDPLAFRTNLAFQAFNNALSEYMIAVMDEEVIEWGDEYNGISFSGSPVDEGLFTITEYTDIATGIEISGEVYVEMDEENWRPAYIVIDDEIDTGDLVNEPDGSGMSLTYPGGGNDTIKVNAVFDFSGETVTGDWNLSGSDVLSIIKDIFGL